MRPRARSSARYMCAGRPSRVRERAAAHNPRRFRLGSRATEETPGPSIKSAPAPSVDIANGSPTGSDATDRIVMSYVSGTLADPHVYFTESTDRGNTWSTPRAIETPGDRGFYTAPAISPNGTDVYVVYNAFTTPFQPTTGTPRALVAV